MNLVVKSLTIISLNLFGFALLCPALLHGQISGRCCTDGIFSKASVMRSSTNERRAVLAGEVTLAQSASRRF
jgi:hypothetical protein